MKKVKYFARTQPNNQAVPNMGRIRYNIGRKLRRISYVDRAIESGASLDPFLAKPSFKLVVGITLIALSMLLGWPLIAFLGFCSIYFQEPLIAAIGGPLAYGLSWLIYGLGLLIAGRQVLTYAGVFNRWLVRVCVCWLSGKSN